MPPTTIRLKRAGLLDLPTELVDDIFELCVQNRGPGLPALLLVSRWASTIAELTLYRRPQIQLHKVLAFARALAIKPARRGWLVALIVLDYTSLDTPATAGLLEALFDSPSEFRCLATLEVRPLFPYNTALPDFLRIVRQLPAITALKASVLWESWQPLSSAVLAGVEKVDITIFDSGSRLDVFWVICSAFPNATSLRVNSWWPVLLPDKGMEALRGMQRLRHLGVTIECHELDRMVALFEHLPRATRSSIIRLDVEEACHQPSCPWTHLARPLPFVTVITLSRPDFVRSVASLLDALDRCAFPSLRTLRICLPDPDRRDEELAQMPSELEGFLSRAGFRLAWSGAHEYEGQWEHYVKRSPKDQEPQLQCELLWGY